MLKHTTSAIQALNRIADEVTEMRQTLENSGKFELNDIGTIILNETETTPSNHVRRHSYPELYGLGSLNMLPLAQISAEGFKKLLKILLLQSLKCQQRQ